MIDHQLDCARARAARNLDAGTVLLPRLDAGDALLEAIAADHDQLALLDPERDARGFSCLHDGGGLVVGHTINDVEAALRRKAREQLAGHALAQVRLPLGIFGCHDLDLGIGFYPLAETGETPWADAL